MAALGKVRMLSGLVSAWGAPGILCYSIKVTFVHRRNSHFSVGEYPEKESWGKNLECETEEKLGLKE